MTNWLYRCSQIPLRTLFTATLKLRVYDRRHVPRVGGAILACNHQSYLDPPLVGCTILPRTAHFMARRSLFSNSFFGSIIRAYDAFPVDRDAADLGAIRHAMRLLRAGEIVMLFPEGTRTRTGRLGEAKAGVAMIAERAGVPVVPVLIEGAFGVWPARNLLPAPGDVNIIFGAPLTARAGFPGPEDFRRIWTGLSHRRRRRLRGGFVDDESEARARTQHPG